MLGISKSLAIEGRLETTKFLSIYVARVIIKRPERTIAMRDPSNIFGSGFQGKTTETALRMTI